MDAELLIDRCDYCDVVPGKFHEKTCLWSGRHMKIRFDPRIEHKTERKTEMNDRRDLLLSGILLVVLAILGIAVCGIVLGGCASVPQSVINDERPPTSVPLPTDAGPPEPRATVIVSTPWPTPGSVQDKTTRPDVVEAPAAYSPPEFISRWLFGWLFD